VTEHAAKVRRAEVRGCPPDVTHQVGCAYCRTVHGPLTERDAEAWKRGHDTAIERTHIPLRDAAAALLAAADDVWVEGTAGETDALVEAGNRLRVLLYGQVGA
jgi:hypothetical protein